MAVRALSIDLFDTLVDIHMDRLPSVEIGGRRSPSTYGLLHAASVQWHGLEFERFAAELGSVDRELREAYYAEHRELPTLERFMAFGRRVGTPGLEMAATLTRTHMDAIREHVTFPGHHAALLARLRGRVRLAVCSNFSHGETARALLGEAGLLEHFDPIVISDEIGIRKPRAEIFEAVLERLGAAPEEVIHIGDSLSADVAGAASLGMHTAWITRRISDPAAALRHYVGPAPEYVISDLAGLEFVLDAE